MGRSDRRGFTLIELLAVITIIGVLASLALPRYILLREKAMISAMKTDLRNLVTSQEGFFSTYGDYAGGITLGPDLPGVGGAGFVSTRPSPQVDIRVFYRNSAGRGEGWSALAQHAGVTSRTNFHCGIFMGDPSYSPNAAVTQAGVSGCWGN